MKRRKRKDSGWFKTAVAVLLVFVPGLYLASMLLHTGGELVAPLDDPYIFYQYARQAAYGQAYVYNNGDGLSLGVSSQLYLLLLSLFAFFGITGDGIVLASFLLGLALYAASARLLYLMGREMGEGVFSARLAVLFFLLSGLAAWHYFSGMDTALFACLVLLFLYLVGREERGKKGRQLAVLLAVLPLVRPEAVLLGLAYLSRLVICRQWKLLWRRASLLISGLGVYLVSVRVLTGEWMPSSAAPKTQALSGGAKGLFNQVYDGSVFLGNVVKGLLAGYFGGETVGYMGGAQAMNAVTLYLPPFFLLLALLGLALVGAKSSGRSVLYVFAFSYHLVFLAIFLPLGWHHHRYIFPLLPPLLLFGAAGISALRYYWGKKPAPLANWFAGFCLVFFALSLLNFASLYGRNSALIYREHYRLSEYLRETTTPQLSVVVDDAGLIKYRADNYLVDLKGIVSPEMRGVARQGGKALFARLARMPADKRPVFALLQKGRADSVAGEWLEQGKLRRAEEYPLINTPAEMVVYRIVYD